MVEQTGDACVGETGFVSSVKNGKEAIWRTGEVKMYREKVPRKFLQVKV